MKARWYRRLLSGRRRRERRQRIEIVRFVEIVYQRRLASRLLGRRRPDRSEWRAICILVLIGRDLIRRDVVVIARCWGRLGGLLRRVIALPFPREVMPPDFQACAKPSKHAQSDPRYADTDRKLPAQTRILLGFHLVLRLLLCKFLLLLLLRSSALALLFGSFRGRCCLSLPGAAFGVRVFSVRFLGSFAFAWPWSRAWSGPRFSLRSACCISARAGAGFFVVLLKVLFQNVLGIVDFV